MKHSVLIGLSLVVLSACTGNSQQWLGADPSAGPTHVAGSAENTTNAFDGKYRDISVQNNSNSADHGRQRHTEMSELYRK